MNARASSFPELDVSNFKQEIGAIQISFVVPVYNVEKYIRQCVLSILEFEGVSFEVILINDGSIDKSMEKIADLIQENPLIKVVSQENQGLSSARNKGLELSKGEYVFFVDSDDKIATSAVREVLSKIQGDEDIIIGDFYNWDGVTASKEPSLADQPFHTTGKLLLQRFSLKNLYSVVWRNIYKRSFLERHQLSFLEGVYYEDAEWTPRCLTLAQKVQYFNQTFYYYRNQRDGSTMNSQFSERKYHDLFKVSQSIEKFASKIEDKTTSGVILRGASNLLLSALKRAKSSDLGIDPAPMLDFYKELELPMCNNKIMQYALFFSQRLFFIILERRSF